MNNLLHLKVSAPGKIILNGEHSVVYGRSAVVGAIGARNHLILTENDSDEISLNFTALGKQCKVPLHYVNEALLKLYNSGNSNEFPVICLETAQKITESASSYLKDFQDDQHKKTVLAVFYLLLGIFCEESQSSLRNGFHIEMISELDLGAGLGSSASFAVCFATAFLSLSRSTEVKDMKCLSLNWKESISQWAFNSEKIMHLNPSGVDNTICTYGGLLKFKKGQPFSPICCQSNLQILLVNSMVSRNTSQMLSKVLQTKTTFPSVTDKIFDAMDEIANEALKIYEIFEYNDTNFNKIKQIFQINNDLLRSIGVSHEKLDQISSISSKYGYSSKLTGAGGGGYMIVLLPQNYKTSTEFKSFCDDLHNEGFKWKEEIVGGEGVNIEIL